MKEFVEKLIEKLDMEITDTYYKSVEGNRYAGIENNAYHNIKKFVMQLVEEFATDINVGSKNQGWILCEERFPNTKDYILLSFSNFSVPVIGRWEEDEEGGAFYIGDEMESCVSQGMIVNAWQQLPKVYRPGEGKDSAKNAQTRIECIRSMSLEEIADKILASEISTTIDFCQEFSECQDLNEKGEEIPDEMCKKCLVKWLNSVEQKKVIPTQHFENRFNTVT